MFDFAWSEFAVIAVVALLAIGPKDMPVAIRAVTGAIKKARRMAAEFQTHVDEMVREANLEEVRDQLSQFRNLDVTSAIERAVDPDHSLRDTFASNPLDPTSARSTGADAIPATDAQPLGEAGVAELERPAEADGDPASAVVAEVAVPAFIPPAIAVAASAEATDAQAPAFIPPAVAKQQRPRAAA